MKRLGIGIAIFALALMSTACNGDSTEDKKEDDKGLRCKVSSSCPVGQVCEGGYCVEWNGCTPEAGQANSCDAGEICDENFECVSITDKCLLDGCGCHVMSSAGGFAAEGNPKIVMPAGASVEVVAILSTDSGVVLPGAVFEASVEGDAFTASGTTLTAAAGAAADATLKVSFDLGGTNADCDADLHNLGDGPDGTKVRFYVVDDTTNEPVTGAIVVVDTNNDGNDDGGGGSTAAGVSTTANDLGDGAYSVTVFANGYNILSVAGLTVNDGQEVALPVSARSSTPKTGGFTGRLNFETYEKRYLNSRPGAIKLGIVTGSIPFKSLLNFNLDLFIGNITDEDCESTPTPPGCYPIQIANLVDTVAALPGGLVLGLASSMIKGHFDSVTRPGRRFAWGLGGELEIPDITGLINIATPLFAEDAGEFDLSTIDIAALMGDIIPLFSNFATGLKGNLSLPAAAVSEWETHITGDYASGRTPDERFPKLDDGSDNQGQLIVREGWGNFSALKVPSLPADWGAADAETSMEGMISFTGVNAPGFGFVPLGLGIGLDCTEGNCLSREGDDAGVFDGVINGGSVCKFNPDPEKNRCSPTILAHTNEGVLGDGKIGLFHAPAFSGLEGYTSKTMVLSLPVSGLLTSDLNDGFRATALVHTGTLANGDVTAVATRDFPGSPGIPDQINGRTYAVGDSGHSLHWVTMATASVGESELTTRWNVYMNGGSSFTAPTVPTALGLGDPFAASVGGDVPVGKVNATHIGFNLEEGSTLAGLAANNGNDLNALFDFVSGMSIETKNVTVANP